VFHAVAAGARRLQAVAVTCLDAPPDATSSLLMPCGACRQVIAEFARRDTPIYIDNGGDWTLDDLLPHSFALGRGDC
jgi:cytidine deaminase